jgi:alkylated DNA repair protein alkB family protein 1
MTSQVDDKKRYKQYRKSTQGHQIDESAWSAFRREEKKYKAKYPSPSLDEVLDLAALLDEDSLSRPGSISVRRFQSNSGQPSAFGIEHIPGQIIRLLLPLLDC